MAQAASDQKRQTERQSDRRAAERRVDQHDFAGDERRTAPRRSGSDRRER
jgi:hypothetical protein